KNPTKRVNILTSIVNMQPYLSNYYGATRFVLEKRLKIDRIKKPDIYLDKTSTRNRLKRTSISHKGNI
ncbi:MAG: hypothetical protein WCC79_04495, partial [Nitrososphaeraceae archaeon]